jgi:hypothetical protein
MDLMKSGRKAVIPDLLASLLLALVSLVPRIYLLAITKMFSSDGVSYLSTALYLRDPELIGEVPKRIYFLLHPLLVLFFDVFIKNIVFSSRLVNLVVGVAIPIIVYLLGKKHFGKMCAFSASLLCAMNPVFIEQSAEIRGDNLFALLTLISIYTFESINWGDYRLRDSVLLGLVLGLTQLSRTNSVMYLLVIIPIWLVRIRHRQLSFKPWFFKTLVPCLLVFFAMFIIPLVLVKTRGEDLPSMVVYTYLDGNITSTSDRETNLFKLNEDNTEYQFLEDVSNTGLKEIFRDIHILPKKYYRNFVDVLKLIFDPVINIAIQLSIFLIPFAFYLFYYWGEIKVLPVVRRLIFWSWPSIFLLPAIHVGILYYLPLIAVMMLIIVWLFDTVSRLGWISKWRMYVFTALMLIIMVPSIAETCKTILIQKAYVNPYLQTGEWLKENSPADSLIMARNPEVFFHAFRRGFRMPLENLDRTLKFAKFKGIDYIVFGPSEQKKRNELFLEAFEEVANNGEKPRLTLVKKLDTGKHIVYIVKVIPENI